MILPLQGLVISSSHCSFGMGCPVLTARAGAAVGSVLCVLATPVEGTEVVSEVFLTAGDTVQPFRLNSLPDRG